MVQRTESGRPTSGSPLRRAKRDATDSRRAGFPSRDAGFPFPFSRKKHAMTLDVVDRLRGLPAADLAHRSRAELETLREELRTAQDSAYRQALRIIDAAAGRPLTNPQRTDLDAAERRTEEAGELLLAVERTLADKSIDLSQIIYQGGGDARDLLVGSNDRYEDGAPLTRSQTVAGFTRSRGLVRPGEEQLSWPRYLRGMVTGDWAGADAERRAMAEGALATGGYLVPQIISAQIIDLARAQTRVLQAGGALVPMTSKTLRVPKWASDPTAAWRDEAAAITPSDGTLGAVELDAKSLSALVKCSRELLEDAPAVQDELFRAFAAAFALKVDHAALYGSGVDPEPEGVINATGVTISELGAGDGLALTDYAPLIDAVGALADVNEAASGILYSPRTDRTLGGLTATDNQPLQVPGYLANVPRFATNQIPNDTTVGASADTSQMFTADWSRLFVGVRTDLRIQVLVERYADTGEVGFVAHWRGDIALARPAAFHVTTGVRP